MIHQSDKKRHICQRIMKATERLSVHLGRHAKEHCFPHVLSSCSEVGIANDITHGCNSMLTNKMFLQCLGCLQLNQKILKRSLHCTNITLWVRHLSQMCTLSNNSCKHFISYILMNHCVVDWMCLLSPGTNSVILHCESAVCQLVVAAAL